MDLERLKKGHMFTDEYFERSYRIFVKSDFRSVSLSEDYNYATSFDYDKSSKTTRLFFQTVQNKMHWAVQRHTAGN